MNFAVQGGFNHEVWMKRWFKTIQMEATEK